MTTGLSSCATLFLVLGVFTSRLYAACLCVTHIFIPKLSIIKLKRNGFGETSPLCDSRNSAILISSEPHSVPGTWNGQNIVLVNEHMGEAHRKSVPLIILIVARYLISVCPIIVSPLQIYTEKHEQCYLCGYFC